MMKIHLLTLAMDAASFAWFQEKRVQYFPPERNHIPAHITLFHRLEMDESSLQQRVEDTASKQPAFNMAVSGAFLMGNGVAYGLEALQARPLHQTLAHAFGPAVVAQDRSFKPHVTVQNKVPRDRAQQLHQHLLQADHPPSVQAIGIDHWHYLQGPWRHIARLPFKTS